MKIPSGKYTVFPTKMGWVGLAASEDGFYAAVLPKPDRNQVDMELRSRILTSPKPFDPKFDKNHFVEIEGRLQNYFLGKPLEISPHIDWSWATPFQKRVLTAVLDIPIGTVVTYGDIARYIGVPSGARAVGGALAANSLPLLIPCHRVVGANGKLGGFTGADLEVKASLINLELRIRKENY